LKPWGRIACCCPCSWSVRWPPNTTGRCAHARRAQHQRLKLDHPGQGRSRRERIRRLVLQNDLGTTGAHVLLSGWRVAWEETRSPSRGRRAGVRRARSRQRAYSHKAIEGGLYDLASSIAARLESGAEAVPKASHAAVVARALSRRLRRGGTRSHRAHGTNRQTRVIRRGPDQPRHR